MNEGFHNMKFLVQIDCKIKFVRIIVQSERCAPTDIGVLVDDVVSRKIRGDLSEPPSAHLAAQCAHAMQSALILN